MNKKSLNNEIVSMRPEANRAKVHTISKLNREVKRLRIQKSFQSEAQKQKNSQKAERLVEELLLIKKLKHDEITKFALSHSKNAAVAILSNPTSTPESRCLSRLALHIGLATRVETFRMQFPNWETNLVSLMGSIGVKVKRSKVIAKSLGLLKQTVKPDAKLEGTSDGINTEEESNAEHVDSDQEEEEEESDTSNNSDQEELEADSDSETDNNSTILKVNFGQQVESDSSCEQLLEDTLNTGRQFNIVKGKRVIASAKQKKLVDHSPCDLALITKNQVDELKLHVNLNNDDSSKLKSKHVKEVDGCGGIDTITKSSTSATNKQVKNKVKANRSGEMKVMRFTELLGLNTTESLVENNNESSSKLANKTVDSFFVTEDGKSEFLSTVPVKDPIIEHRPIDYAPQEVFDSSGRRLNRREIRSRLHGNKGFQGFSSRPSVNRNHNKWYPADVPATSKWQDTTAQLKPKIFLPPVVDEPLHPSWEAKKKQKEQSNIVFQGKKIKFDE